MSSSYGQPASPTGRRVVPPGRVSATNLGPSSYYDISGGRMSRDPIPPARVSAERAAAPKAIPIRHRSPPRRARDDDFAVRPRRMSLDPGDATSRRPLGPIVARSPNRSVKPVITVGGERSSSPLSKVSKPGGVQLEAAYIIPGSSSSRQHHRHSSLTTGEQLRALDKAIQDREYTATNRTALPRPAPRADRAYAFEYTGPRKEFERELAPLPRPRDRRESHSMGRVRPSSMILPGHRDPEYVRHGRDDGSSSVRGAFDAFGRPEGTRHVRRPREGSLDREVPLQGVYVRNDRESRYRDANRSSRLGAEEDYVPYADENKRHARHRRPTIEGDKLEPRHNHRKHHEDKPDTRARDYESLSDRGEDRSRRTRDKEDARRDDRYREYSDRDRNNLDELRDRREKTGEHPDKGLLAGAGAAAAGVAAAGLIGENSKRHRNKEGFEGDGDVAKNNQGYLREPDRGRGDGSEASISDETRLSGERDEERRRRRRREREREDREYREAKEYDRRMQEDETTAGGKDVQGGESRALVVASQEESELRQQKSYERRPSGTFREQTEKPEGASRRRHYRHSDGRESYSDSSSVASQEPDDIRREPRAVTPPQGQPMALSRPPPKGILKKARDKFPEEANPVREGVAPLDAAKRGIPADARWTRINRRLVNPEALEQDGVRFEEGPDYVIVLKVLNQEEITRYAQKTHEIRERRRQLMGDGPDPAATSVQESNASQQP